MHLFSSINMLRSKAGDRMLERLKKGVSQKSTDKVGDDVSFSSFSVPGLPDKRSENRLE